ncbi:YgfZ/GcvT domain-containing protein [Jatrophihabitans fulvus]
MTANLQSAAPGTGRDADVPAHYGDPLREQRVLETSAGVVDRSNRAVLAVPGVDRLGWLHSICSQHVSDLADGDSTETLILSPNGHVELHWQLTELDGTVWLDTEPDGGDGSLTYLQKMIFMKRVEPADVSDAWAVLTLAGPRAAAVLAAAGLPDAPPAGRAVALPAGGFVRGMPSAHSSAPGVVDLVVPRASKDAVIAALVAAGAEPAGLLAWEALRVAARAPRAGQETDHRTIPHEVGWIGGAVHLNKGCYRGQETVARVHNLGRPPRRLVLVHLAGESDELPPPGTPVEAGGRAIGFLGTAVHHWELGPIALAVVKRTVADDAELTVAGQAARIDGD